MKYLLGSFLLLLLLCSCKDKNTLTSEASKMYGKNIILPTAELNKNTKFKIVNYIDSLGCIKCKLRLKKWVQLNNDTSLFDIVFVSHPHSYQNVKLLMEIDSVQHIQLIEDKNNKWYNKNEISENEMLHTFLLDHNNTIIVLGNPVQNDNIKDLYMKQIHNNTKTQ